MQRTPYGFSGYGGQSASALPAQDSSENAMFERQMQKKQLEDMAESLMSQNPSMGQKIQMELNKRYALNPRKLNPAQTAALQMFSPSQG